jgi:prepilin-type N-terminal cleavage/methylation domain-containing protein
VAKRKGTDGFVLIEVLVAVAVAAVLLTALLRAFVTTWQGINTVREEAEAMLIARSLVSAVAPRENTVEASQRGNIGRYAWALEVRKALAVVAPADAESGPQATNPWTLYRIAVVITAPNGRRTSLETNRLSRPAQ